VFRFLMDVVFKSLHSVLCDDAATTATFTLSLHDALPIWVCLGHLHETFVVNHNALNTDFHLTRKNKTWGWWRITDGTTLMQDIERAAVCVTRWHGRTPRLRLGRVPLNTERLPHLCRSASTNVYC